MSQGRAAARLGDAAQQPKQERGGDDPAPRRGQDRAPPPLGRNHPLHT